MLRTAALIATLVGGIGAVALMYRAGPDAPPLLHVLMGGWVASPFVALGCAEAISVRRRATLHVVALVITVATLGVYAAIAAHPTRFQTPFFVLSPPVALGVVAVALLIDRMRR